MNIQELLRRAYVQMTTLVRARQRLMSSKKDLQHYNKILFKGLTKAQRSEIKKYWKEYGVTSFDIEWIDLYSSFYGKFDKHFIPDDIYFSKIDLFYSNAAACQYLDDKNMYSLLFEGVKMPTTVLRKVKGVFLDENYHFLTEEEVVQKCLDAKNIIIKPSVMSCGGIGIHFWNANDDLDILKKRLKKPLDFVIQEVVKQHPILSSLHKDSLNTIRIVTLFINNDVQVLSSILRMGANGNKVDNMSSGGFACGIDDDGRLKKYAFNKDGQKIERHPQGTMFLGVKIPGYHECLEIARFSALRLIGYTRLISWDFAIDVEGKPILIEANLSTGGLRTHQCANGPIFGSLTDQVLDEVFRSKK